MKPGIVVLVVAGTAIGALAGCTSTPTAVRSTPTPSNGVPYITQPQLTLSQFANRPCEIFGGNQFDFLGLDQPGTPASTGCRWTPDGIQGDAAIVVDLLGTAQSLKSLYAKKNSVPYFEPTEVFKYPAVNKDKAEGTTGTCTTAVAIAYDATFEVQAEVTDTRSPNYATPCDVATRVAEVVVANLQGGG